MKNKSPTSYFYTHKTLLNHLLYCSLRLVHLNGKASCSARYAAATSIFFLRISLKEMGNRKDPQYIRICGINDSVISREHCKVHIHLISLFTIWQLQLECQAFEYVQVYLEPVQHNIHLVQYIPPTCNKTIIIIVSPTHA
jgi:hypothetical protein